MIKKIFALKRIHKQICILFYDVVISIFSTYVFYNYFLFDKLEIGIIFFIAPILIFFPVYFAFGMYNMIFRYSDIVHFLYIFFASLINCIAYIYFFRFFIYLNFVKDISYPILAFQPFAFFTLVFFSRISIIIIYKLINPKISRNNVLIYGSGEAAYESIKLLNNFYNIINVIDDDKNKHNKILNNIKIVSPNNISKIILKNNIEVIYVAIASLKESERNKIINNLSQYDIQIKILPDIANFIDQEITLSDFKNINEQDLLDREIVIETFDFDFFGTLSALVTGGGGSIGSEICKQLLKTQISKLIVIDNSEYNLYQIEKILNQNNIYKIEINYILLDIKNYDSIKKLIMNDKPNLIFHTAAYKHVPIVENNIIESINNNFLSTINLIDISIEYNVKRFVYISSDKAVRPTNIMGATKRLSELYIQAINDKFINDKNKTIISIVRFGNVIGSSGSAINLFSDQIRSGGPVTVTHPEATRFFMTIKEAVLLIFECCRQANGGEVFLLDMGEPIKIIDLAKKMIKLHGLKVNTPLISNGIDLKIIGLRSGEKIYEELLIGSNSIKTDNKYIFKAKENFIKYNDFIKDIEIIKENITKDNYEVIIKIIEKNVESFSYNKN